MLFKHKEEKSTPAEKKVDKPEQKVESTSAPLVPPAPVKDVSPEALRELLEKNLKWSQIIYEQNRKINSKLFWTAFATWVRLFILIGVFAAAAWFLPPILSDVIGRYNQLMSDPTSILKGSLNINQPGSTPAQDLCTLLPANLQESCRSITSKK